jgi:NADH-quinone oxidoreductase subunit M
VCHCNLFIFSPIILSYECIYTVNYTFVGAITTYLAGDKLASKVALFFSLSSLGCAVLLLNQFNGENISVLHQWINQPNISFALQADGLAIAMILLTLALTYHYILFF